MKKAIVSVIGTDKKGIIAKVSGLLFELGINVEDISQTIMQQYFTMIMLVDLSEAKKDFDAVCADLDKLGKEIGVDVRMQSEQIFTAMHRI